MKDVLDVSSDGERAVVDSIEYDWNRPDAPVGFPSPDGHLYVAFSLTAYDSQMARLRRSGLPLDQVTARCSPDVTHMLVPAGFASATSLGATLICDPSLPSDSVEVVTP